MGLWSGNLTAISLFIYTHRAPWMCTGAHTKLKQIFILVWELVEVWSCVDQLTEQTDDQQTHGGKFKRTTAMQKKPYLPLLLRCFNLFLSSSFLWCLQKNEFWFTKNIPENLCAFCRQTDPDSVWTSGCGDVSGTLRVVHRRRLLRPVGLARCHPAAVVLERKA